MKKLVRLKHHFATHTFAYLNIYKYIKLLKESAIDKTQKKETHTHTQVTNNNKKNEFANQSRSHVNRENSPEKFELLTKKTTNSIQSPQPVFFAFFRVMYIRLYSGIMANVTML